MPYLINFTPQAEKDFLKLPIENYVLDYFVIPSLTLRISSGLRLRTSSAPSLLFWGSATDRRIPSGDPSASPQGDKKGSFWASFLSFWTFSSFWLFFCHSER